MGQCIVGKICIKIEIGEMNSLILCYIIEAKTSYDLLLGKTWLHENGVVPSTLHQCFKYSHGGEVKCVMGIKELFSIK